MNISAILFDMDGTLLPMDENQFTESYFHGLSRAMLPFGIAPELLVKAVWAGVKSMVKNDGTATDESRFWDTFTSITGKSADLLKPETMHYYQNDFYQVKAYTSENPLASEAVRLAHTISPRVILATNPLFPMEAQTARMSFVGLKQDDFDLVTSYEKETYCKPNPMYYQSICDRFGLNPKECLMIGNDEDEDMNAASSIGMQCFLVTDCLIPSKSGRSWTGERGSFKDLICKLQQLSGMTHGK